jgi:hypothetical protein
MRIYIEEDSKALLAKNNKKILDRLNKYLVNKYDVIYLYSKEGIFQVYDNNIFKINIKTEHIENTCIDPTNENNNLQLLIDDSVSQKEIVYQLPFDHISIPVSIHTYSLNKYGLKLIIEFNENITPINYYFEYNPTNKNNNLPIEDINVFLSLLN